MCYTSCVGNSCSQTTVYAITLAMDTRCDFRASSNSDSDDTEEAKFLALTKLMTSINISTNDFDKDKCICEKGALRFNFTITMMLE